MEREDLESDARQFERGRRPVRLGGAHAWLGLDLGSGSGSGSALGFRSGSNLGLDRGLG